MKDKNQCDGCNRGLPLKDGEHIGDDGGIVGCDADRYDQKPALSHGDMQLKRIKDTASLWELIDENEPKGLAATMLTTAELIGIAKGLPPEIMKEAGLVDCERLQELEAKARKYDKIGENDGF